MPDPQRGPRWFVVETDVGTDELDELSGELWAAGIAGVEERAADDATHIVVSTSSDHLDAVQRVLGDRSQTVRAVAADEGLDSWRAWATPTRVGAITIEPSWLDPTATPDDIAIVRIDPEGAFGSGAHVTTRLALELLQGMTLAGRHVLDVGTGSGVLAIAAARLGAARVVAVDVDAAAQLVARHNVERNGVKEVVDVRDGGIDTQSEHFDVVVANIEATTLVALAPAITQRLAGDAQLVLSGVLASREPELVAAFCDVALTTRQIEGDWVALAGARRGSD